MTLNEIKHLLESLPSDELIQIQEFVDDRLAELTFYKVPKDNVQELLIEVREIDRARRPNLDLVTSAVLFEGPKKVKEATIWRIVHHATGEFHHYSLRLSSYHKVADETWQREGKRTINLDDPDGNTIRNLTALLNEFRRLDKPGQCVVLPNSRIELAKILGASANSQEMLALIEDILNWIDDKPEAIEELRAFAAENSERSKRLTAALNYGRYVAKLQEFRDLIDINENERVYQAFLEDNDWLFGSEYRELHVERTLVAGTQLDFPLRRTVDDRLEIIEIKRPTKETLFREDSEHLSPKSALYEAIAQVSHYFEALDRNYYELVTNQGIQVDRTKARIVIGRNGSQTQQRALQRLNSVLNRIEVITFDQLIEIGQRTINLLQSKQHSEPESVTDLRSDIPF